MKLFWNEKGNSLIEIIITCFVLFTIGSCIFGAVVDETKIEEKIVKVTEKIKIVTEKVKEANTKEAQNKPILTTAYPDCTDGFKTVMVDGVEYYIGKKIVGMILNP